ncbi:DNA-directed RNA polymerase, omega subunit [Plesiocystis pacifica SIR-1]|uniref:DNA-directed RNA polymerase subunit omega n=1 Tax=Plesiocystis pacifica SIR-1 TaxID=391625 RepID=A6GDR9_9BACT|nr:DNA-directed RNA polymerase subunit omega [Plesiocystis pacifica]EDM75958.1 DNA-directed RNA polymerase, omega subunit [Plesiocystis pacifica SIR-1]
MARVTVEDCLEQVPNRFALTVLASRRARALSEGKGTAQVESDNKSGVVALREVAKGVVRYTENVEETIKGYIEEQRASLMASSGNEATFIDAASFDDDDDDDEDDVKELSADPDKLQDDDDDDDDDEDGDSDSADSSDGTVTSSDDSANLEDVDVDDLESDDLDDDDD